MNRYRLLEKRLDAFVAARQEGLLRGGSVGLEREALRVAPDGSLSHRPHPRALGSALTHPWITTDFSEALIELITPPLPDVGAAIDFLCDLETYVYEVLEDEFLWATSMPCILRGEADIPIAWYGTSNPGLMKHIYRVGLGNRYGRAMQLIAGVHFNYSCNEGLWAVYQVLEHDARPLREFIDHGYFAMLRNLLRLGWMVPYLFGCSPAVCKTFVGDQPTDMAWFDETTYYYPYATSLRMGDIGYQNNKAYESGFKARYDNLDLYIASLQWATETPDPRYEQIGVRVDGRYRQLNPNILQIENEYYSTVRPKQPLRGDEKPVIALRERGVQYVELRSLDVDAFSPAGANGPELRFLEAFMLFCLLHESPRLPMKEAREVDRNEFRVAHRGREPGLRLERNGREVPLREWGLEVLDAMTGICEILDGDQAPGPYTQALERQRETFLEPERTPSARMLREMRARGEGFHAYARHRSEILRRFFRRRRLHPAQREIFDEVARASRRRQAELEAGDSLPFDAYLARYFAQT
ncbi:MAG TPA: glutamate--cysteine ligase [Chromatiales bacterium]|nr:glutamate--cysteine ligase [Chromatiales bacterium]